jgi:hypothetical protein
MAKWTAKGYTGRRDKVAKKGGAAVCPTLVAGVSRAAV